MLGGSLEEQSVVPHVPTRENGDEFPAVARHLGNHFGWHSYCFSQFAGISKSGERPILTIVSRTNRSVHIDRVSGM